jgi:hypothetical protein
MGGPRRRRPACAARGRCRTGTDRRWRPGRRSRGHWRRARPVGAGRGSRHHQDGGGGCRQGGGSGREGRRLCVTAAAHAWTPDGWGALPAGQVQGPSARHLRPVTGLSREYVPEITGKQAHAQRGTLGQLPATLEVHRWRMWSSHASRCPTMPPVISTSGGAHGACRGFLRRYHTDRQTGLGHGPHRPNVCGCGPRRPGHLPQPWHAGRYSSRSRVAITCTMASAQNTPHRSDPGNLTPQPQWHGNWAAICARSCCSSLIRRRLPDRAELHVYS